MAQDEALFGRRHQGMEASGEANCRRWKLVAQSLETKRATETDDPYEVHATFSDASGSLLFGLPARRSDPWACGTSSFCEAT